jgi:hypothetical protein
MIDQDPLPWWTRGASRCSAMPRPMVPRGSNGAGRRYSMRGLSLARRAPRSRGGARRLRIGARGSGGSTNRVNPPDAILREVYERTGDKPFTSIDDVISAAELKAMSEGYKRIAGYDRASLAGAGGSRDATPTTRT